MTSQQQESLTEQWEAIEETAREKYADQAADKWDTDIGPSEREQYLDQAADKWDTDIGPDGRVKYVEAALEEWDDGADERRERFLSADDA